MTKDGEEYTSFLKKSIDLKNIREQRKKKFQKMRYLSPVKRKFKPQ